MLSFIRCLYIRKWGYTGIHAEHHDISVENGFDSEHRPTWCPASHVRCNVQVSYMASSLLMTEKQVWLTINCLYKWADDSVFRFPAQKTVCVAFTTRRGTFAERWLLLYGNTVPVCDKHKFLGMIFDKKLSFVPHMNYIKKCSNLLNVLSHRFWEADKYTLLHYESIWLATGVFRALSVISLYAMSGHLRDREAFSMWRLL